MVFGPAGVHAHQHQRPVLGVGAAGTGVDADHGAFLVVGAAEQALQLPAIQIGPQLLQRLIGFGEQFLIRLEAVDLNGGLGIGYGRLPLAELLELGLHLIELAHLGLGLLLVIPEVGLGGKLLEVLLACFQCRNVKDSPGHCPGGQ